MIGGWWMGASRPGRRRAERPRAWERLAAGLVLAAALSAALPPLAGPARATSITESEALGAQAPAQAPADPSSADSLGSGSQGVEAEALGPAGTEATGPAAAETADPAAGEATDPAAVAAPGAPTEEAPEESVEDARYAWLEPISSWFTPARFPTAVATLAFAITLLILITHAREGRELYIRRIAGLEAVDEAVGRATEMGRPILYTPGLDPMEEVATVASINILGQVARRAGQYETRLIMPNRDPIVMTVAQEVVREALTEVGRPDLYDPNDIYYTTQSQFGYAAAVCGVMMRERPATNFFIGHWYAESLILAETGNATGAIQIAGTDSDSQLPFFICACDYTLIGEELYAGSVYLSREPLLLGALKGQDLAKVAILAILILGTILSFLGLDVRSWLG